jgi:hypothetical protein
MSIHTAAGTKFSISASLPATNDAGGYAALTYTEVGEVTNIADFGANSNVVNHSPLSDPIIQKYKGSADMGGGSLDFASLKTDAGQILLKTAAAYNTYAPYSVKVEESDGSISYFKALFTSFVKKIGTIDNVVAASVNMAITSKVIDV